MGWAKGVDRRIPEELTNAISTLTQMPGLATEFLEGRMVQGNTLATERRRAALQWVDAAWRRPMPMSWHHKPKQLSPAHWIDLQTGAQFFSTRDAAIAVLDQIEMHMANHDRRLSLDRALPEAILEKIDQLRFRAIEFLQLEYDPTPGKLATIFCKECSFSDPSVLIQKLVVLDERVLRLRDRCIIPAAAFQDPRSIHVDSARSPEEGVEGLEPQSKVEWPEGISHRIHNLYWLNLDFKNELDASLHVPDKAVTLS